VQLKTKAGLALVAMGIGVFAAWKWWTSTRNFLPLNLPMPLMPGESVSAPFKLNYDGLYLIEITAEPKIPLDELHCLLGVGTAAGRCKGLSSAIVADWIVSSDGRELRRGNSGGLHSVPVQSEAVTRVIGEFPGRAGDYNLTVTVRSDAHQLMETNPRLRVGVASIAYTDLASASALVFAAAFVCVMFGAVLLGIAWFANRRDLSKITAP
jgi:hypothetical protein